jgi:hypothetical protein
LEKDKSSSFSNALNKASILELPTGAICGAGCGGGRLLHKRKNNRQKKQKKRGKKKKKKTILLLFRLNQQSFPLLFTFDIFL